MSKYTAFISYRHLTPDADIAKKLHTMIENYGIPGSVKRKTGMRRCHPKDCSSTRIMRTESSETNLLPPRSTACTALKQENRS